MPAFIDLTGQIIGNWKVLYRFGSSRGKILWRCKCMSCNKTVKEFRSTDIKVVVDCGCLSKAGFVGKTFGRLLIIKKFRKCVCAHKHYICRCECGKLCLKIRGNVTSGHTKSCGCLRKENPYKTHGFTNHPLYDIYRGMVRRCYSGEKKFKRYAGRSIKVCDAWLGDSGITNFINFITRQHPNYIELLDKGYSLERRDYNGNYDESNCCLADPITQANNKSTNRRERAFGEEDTLANLIRKYAHKSLTYYKVRYRVSKGWSVEESLITPYKIKFYMLNDTKFSRKSDLSKFFNITNKIVVDRCNSGWCLLEALVTRSSCKRMTLNEISLMLNNSSNNLYSKRADEID